MSYRKIRVLSSRNGGLIPLFQDLNRHLLELEFLDLAAGGLGEGVGAGEVEDVFRDCGFFVFVVSKMFDSAEICFAGEVGCFMRYEGRGNNVCRSSEG